MAIAEPILPSAEWLSLPKAIADEVRRAYCIDGVNSGAYRQAVAVARKWSREHPCR